MHDKPSHTSLARRLLKAATGIAAGLAMLAASAAAHAQSVIRDTEVERFLHDRTRPILEAAGLDADRVQYLLVASDDLNAFATFRLRMGLNTGLILEAKTPNELFGVIAHETGHLSGGHMMRTDEIERAARAPMAIALGLGIVAALAGSPDGAMGIIGSSGTFGTLNALRYMQTQESAADVAGIKALEKAGMSGKGLVDFFYNFRNVETFSNAERYAFFRTHPLSRERIQSITSLAKRQSHYGEVDPPEVVEAFKIVQAKLAGFMEDPVKTFRTYPESDTSYPARYARVIATYKQGNWDKALTDLDTLITEQPDNAYLHELKGQIYFETGRAVLAKPEHLKSVQLMPQAPLLHLNLGQTLIAIGDKENLDQAVVVLRESLKYEEDNSFTWSQLAQAYDSLNQPGMARLATAEAQFYNGDYEGARTTAVRAQKFFPTTSPEFRRARDLVMVTSSEMGINPVEGETKRRP
ncbi:M48 family metalloprotease [Asticcacaulis sp. AC402]|uniref:M48 family metalloprotease n=1 Tax=Asticcacaulis sp. AC402 TaxID=1282361 RepID=UPI0003C412D4|nr:M48 family metalloprotease [Asticcacaulis sp. AC402]ESQ76426.1 peptidase M48 [Asticcacaulis sp. AC402]